MDFSLGEELEAVRDLAREIFTDRAVPERLAQVEASDSRIDARLWDDLSAAGLLAAPLPEEAGGAGLGPAGLAVLLEEQGRTVAPVPVWPSLAGALAVAGHGDARQRAALLPPVATGTARLTVALEEFAPADPLQPSVTATAVSGQGDGSWTLDGTKAVVPSPAGAGHVLVSAGTPQGPGLFLVATDAAGVTWEYAHTTSHDRSGHLTLDGVDAEPVGAPGSGAVEATVRLAHTALAALQLGVVEGALAYAAEHLREREQFGRPLATFQAVQHQLADCYIDIEALRVTVWGAVDALAGGSGCDGEDPELTAAEVESAVLVAKWWAAEAGLTTVHRVQHVHGGIGVDTDYPVHRHFLWGRQLSATLGGAHACLARLGSVLTGAAVTE